jgi:hypothetical protein
MIYVLVAALGFVTWTLTEYTLHRFLGHELRIKTLFKVEHMTHHANKDYFAPLWMKFVAAAVIGSSMYFVLSFLLPSLINLTFTISFISSFLGYEMYHYIVHAVPPKVFGTYAKTDVVQVHKNFAMDWLKNNQEVYKTDYVVKESTPFT